MRKTTTLTLLAILIICMVCVGFFVSRTQWVEERMQGTSLSGAAKHQPPRTAVALNKWFSGAYSFPSEPLFAYPGAFRLTTAGLEIGIPQVTTTEKLVAAPFVHWCSVRGSEPITNATVAQYTDWGITVAFETQGGTWQAHITQGSPVVYISDLTTPLHITCEPSILPSTQTARAVFAQPGTKGALLFQSNDGSAVQASELPYCWRLSSASNQYRVSLLPFESEQMVKLFSDQEWNQVVSTEISWDASEKEILTIYDLQTSSNQPPLITLLPHQAANLSEDIEVLASYDSVLGSLQLISKSRFTTKLPQPNLPLQFTATTDATDRALIVEAIRNDAQQYVSEAPPAGVYFKGTWIGALTSLVQLSELYAVEPEHSQLRSRLESILTANLEGYAYDADNRLFSTTNPEFGHEKGNDHHFHYGYYLRSMAVLSAKDPVLLAKFQPIAEAMISDIAQAEESKKYPKLHYFSPYEGHSWADAQGKFADGNNQESTSEALQAWYGVKLWGEVIGQSELVTLGSWLYAQELSATQNYWYAATNPFPSGYERSMASLVWGGKREFNTWFSAHPLHIHGIQWLPLTPASVYGLAQLPLAEATAELERLESNPAGHEWGDLYLSALSFVDAERARSMVPTVTSFAGTKSEAVFLQFVLR